MDGIELMVLKERMKRLIEDLSAEAQKLIVEKINAAARQGGSIDWQSVLKEWFDRYMKPFGLTIFDVGYGKSMDVAPLNDQDVKNVEVVVYELINDILPVMPDYAEELAHQIGFFLLAAARAKYVLRKDLRKIPTTDEAAVMKICPELIKYTTQPNDTDNPAYTDYEPNSWKLVFTPNWNNIPTIYHAYVFGADGPKYWRPSSERNKRFVVALAANHLIGVGDILDVRVYRVSSKQLSYAPALSASPVDDVPKDIPKMEYPIRGVPAAIVDPDIVSGIIEELVLPNPSKSTEPVKKDVRVIGIAFVEYGRIEDIQKFVSLS